MNLLITSIGKRVGLIKHLKKSFTLFGVDANEENVGRDFVHAFYIIPRVNEENYINKLIEICKLNNIVAIIPLYEGEFIKLIKNENRFNEIGTRIILSNENILNISKSKTLTFEFFKHKNLNIPYVYNNDQVSNIINESNYSKLPLIIKPDDGMGSNNVFKITSIKQLMFFKDYIQNSIVQQYIEGSEYTVDVLVDFNGEPIYIIPRLRLEVRAGEVSKSKTVNDKEVIGETIKVLEILNTEKDEKGKGLVGPLTIQFIKNKNGEIYLLEINPRFGGGVPLAFEAGADYGNALLQILKGEKLDYKDEFRELTMLRYDEAIFR